MSEITVFDRISEMVNGEYNADQIMVVQDTVAKGTSTTELGYFLNVCRSVGMNPFNREIWCYKSGGRLLVFAGRDGFLRKAQENPLFDGLRSCEVCKNDDFQIDVANNTIRHNVSFGDRGPIAGAYCVVFRKGGEPTVELVEFAPYNKGQSAWKTHPAEMIKKVAEAHALKKAFGISGVQCESDFTDPDQHGNVSPINTTDFTEYISDQQYVEINELCEVNEEVKEALLKEFGSLENIPVKRYDKVKSWAVAQCTK
jgi:phage recombination protein Bet